MLWADAFICVLPFIGILPKALCKRKIKAGREFVEQDLSFNFSNDNRDALAKAIYSKIFDKLISQINNALSAGAIKRTQHLFIPVAQTTRVNTARINKKITYHTTQEAIYSKIFDKLISQINNALFAGNANNTI